jgi:hypothetical protein
VQLRGRIGVALRAFQASGANRTLRLVQAARLASVTGRWAYTVTLAVFAFRTGGTAGVALATIVRLAPAAAAAPFAGTLLRRRQPGAVLARGGALRTVALGAAGALVLGHGPLAGVYVCVAVESAASSVLRPVQNGLLPSLARTPEELTAANLALSVIESAGVLLGPLLGALLLHGTSIGIVFLAASGAYLLSTLLLLPVRPASDAVDDRWWASAAAAGERPGLRAVTASGDLRIVLALYAAQNVVAGTLNVLVVVTALRLLGLGQSSVGALTAAIGVGGLAGGVFVLARLRRRQHGVDFAIGLLLWGAPLVLLAALSSEAAAFALLAIVGVGVTIVDVSALTLLQRAAQGELLAHALGLLQGIFVAAVGLGTLLAPVLVAALGIRGALVAAGIPLPVLAAALWSRLRRFDDAAPGDSPWASLLAANPIFAPLGDGARSRLATQLHPVSLAAGQVVFAQGEHGDGFYLIESGEVAVEIDGRRVRTLGSGDSFGEIALLRDVPRTATIRTVGAVGLLRLDRGPFLDNVTGDAASTRAADRVVGARLGLSVA